MIHYVCVATESKLYFPYLKKLLPELTVLGMGMKWKGFIMKYELLIEYLETLNDDDIVCFIDAYDVLPTKNIVNLEKQFVNFSKRHTGVKMIVGYDKVYNKIHEFLEQKVFDTIEGDRINSGQFIGYVKNVKYIVSSILSNTTSFQTDQIELTKYIKQNKNCFFIDKERVFFNVITKPLTQITNTNTKCSFIHANGNGCLEYFLLEHHEIVVNPIDTIYNLVDNVVGVYKKIHIYKSYLFK